MGLVADHLGMTSTASLTIRSATHADADAIHRLAQLDSQRARTGEHVLAELDGELVAAVAVDDGATYADPFVRSASAVALLHAHIDAVRPTSRRRLIARPALAA